MRKREIKIFLGLYRITSPQTRTFRDKTNSQFWKFLLILTYEEVGNYSVFNSYNKL